MGIAYTVQLIYGITIPNLLMLAVVFFMMWGVYRINRILDVKEDFINTHTRIKWRGQTHKLSLWLPPIIAFCIALTLALIVNFLAFAFIIIAFFWIVGYSLRIPGYKKIKEITVLKTIYASVAWGMLVFIVTFILGKAVSASTWAIFFLVLLNISISEIVYDVRDVVGDKKLGINTIPVIFGLKKTKQILTIMAAIAAILPVIMIHFNYLPTYMISLSILIIFTYYVIMSLDNKRSMNFICDVLVGGEQILWPVASLIIFLVLLL